MDNFDQEAATWDEKPMRIERARVVAQGIRDEVPVDAGMTAFEYGCGTGLLSFALQPYLGHITLADSSSGMLAVVEEKIAASGVRNMTPLKLDLITDPPPKLKAQLIYTLMTLHHIPETERVLESFYNLLDAPGYLCIADLEKEDGSFHGPGFAGHTGFDKEALGQLVKDTGFQKALFRTVFQVPRMVETEMRYFPLFLMTAEKPAK